jgi:hypothetical protein
MAIPYNIDYAAIGRRFAEVVQPSPSVRGLWSRQVLDSLELWLLTEPIGSQQELDLYATSAWLYQAYPDVSIQFHLVNPLMFEPGTAYVGDVIPGGAVDMFPSITSP